MAKDFNNRLITPELEKAMQDYPLYSQDSKKKDAVCIAVFFIGNARSTIKRIYVDFDRGRTRWTTLPNPQTACCF